MGESNIKAKRATEKSKNLLKNERYNFYILACKYKDNLPYCYLDFTIEHLCHQFEANCNKQDT